MPALGIGRHLNPLEDFRRTGEFRERKPGYKVLDLVPVLISQSRIPMRESLSGAHLDYLTRPLPETWNKSEMQTLLDIWMEMFDRTFFFNSIRRAVGPLVFTKIDSPGILTYAQFKSGWDGSRRQIIVDLHDELPEFYEGTREQWYICQVMHEMSHAFLGIFRCKCRPCLMRVVDHSKNGGEGISGHGPAWCNVIVALQEALQSTVRWPVECNIVASAQQNIEGWVPNTRQLENWGFSPEDIDEAMEVCENKRQSRRSRGGGSRGGSSGPSRGGGGGQPTGRINPETGFPDHFEICGSDDEDGGSGFLGGMIGRKSGRGGGGGGGGSGSGRGRGREEEEESYSGGSDGSYYSGSGSGSDYGSNYGSDSDY
ncbi:hypothetical protein GLAREA_10480 [Glarea lozoyensis ATCC 20868]|uniref:SprT-like domain-containing protein n=1 Tax=Glarea lozoyensis (strain ATCC 20868 / MF5171) TaxID=1116229 RepID=S3DAS1_GLAL2|nr:uncharacterized protein GLAREA_10480 [Glarea lozoyensis ATCC 20868]EPE34785.1 hypothetical protein GLAREA_10480 [Glarea lozoyensis ATCC 20868]